jgi:hypothetical protein
VLDVNNMVAPFDNPWVIEAINRAVNRQQLIDVANFGYGRPVFQPFPDGDVAHDPRSMTSIPTTRRRRSSSSSRPATQTASTSSWRSPPTPIRSPSWTRAGITATNSTHGSPERAVCCTRRGHNARELQPTSDRRDRTHWSRSR